MAKEKEGDIKSWIPLASWIACVLIVTYLIFLFYTPSPTIIVTYFVIVLLGFYILWRQTKMQKKIKGKGGKSGPALQKRK